MLPSPGEINSQEFIFLLVVIAISAAIVVISRRLLKVSFPYFFMGMLGLIIGLAVGSLAVAPLSGLPGIYGKWLPLIVDIFVTVAFLDLFLAQAKPAAIFFRRILHRLGFDGSEETTTMPQIVLDTSVLIDGRIEEIARSGFVMAKLLIPQFVLTELQAVADSEEPLKRAKGRKGLEVLDRLQHDQDIATEIIDDLSHHKEAVDSKLVKIAKLKKAKIMTVDFNLNKIAKIQNVHVLNINELAEAIKPVLIPGENILVKVIQEGKEPNQGVGYLPDGTMIVVEGGDKYIGKEVESEVVRIFQTVAGKMVFVQPKKKNYKRGSL